MFALAFDSGSAPIESGGALSGGMLQAMSHATAKAAMFMAAGLIHAALGHDRIAGLSGIGRAAQLTVTAFALGGVALIGLPPSGAYLAKDLLLRATADTGQWWWKVVIQAGGIFTSSYLLLVLAHALMPAGSPLTLRAPVSRIPEIAALTLAVCSLLLGLFPWDIYLSVSRGGTATLFDLAAILKTLPLVLSGGLLALLLGRWAQSTPALKDVSTIVDPARQLATTMAGPFECFDATLRRWPAADLSAQRC